MKVIVMMGIPGSGKTTWIGNNLDYEEFPDVVSLDDIRERLNGDAASQKNMPEVVEIAHARLKWLLLHGKNAVWDATNIVAEHREQILKTCNDFGAETHLVVMITPPEVARRRNASRTRVVPDRAMNRMWEAMLDEGREVEQDGRRITSGFAGWHEISYVVTTELPKGVVVEDVKDFCPF
jgi:hypothetical protein